MALPHAVINKIRSELRHRLGWKSGGERAVLDDNENVVVDERFFTFDRDTQQIVSNVKFMDYNSGKFVHLIFDASGNLIKQHEH